MFLYFRILILFFCICGISEVCGACSNILDGQRQTYIVLVRHLQTTANLSGVSHGQAGGELTLESSEGDAKRLRDFGWRFGQAIQGLYSGTDLRHFATLGAIALGAEKPFDIIEKLSNFDEFDLGKLKGKTVKEILSAPEFSNMITNPRYKIPYDDGKKMGDSLHEVKRKFIKGLRHVIRQAARKKAEGIHIICTSRLTLNAGLQELLQDRKFINFSIPNCGAYIFKYTYNGNELNEKFRLNLKDFTPVCRDCVVLSGNIHERITDWNQYAFNVIDFLNAQYAVFPPQSTTPCLIDSDDVWGDEAASSELSTEIMGMAPASTQSDTDVENSVSPTAMPTPELMEPHKLYTKAPPEKKVKDIVSN